jgi:hypothetical protein
MSMPHFYSDHKGVMSYDSWDRALELGENIWQASHVAMILEASSMIEGQNNSCLNTFVVRALELMCPPPPHTHMLE